MASRAESFTASSIMPTRPAEIQKGICCPEGPRAGQDAGQVVARGVGRIFHRNRIDGVLAFRKHVLKLGQLPVLLALQRLLICCRG